MSRIFDTLSRIGVIPVVAVDAVDQALPLADALLEGGLDVVEITFRTAAAAEVIALLNDKRPELITGAGTILTEDQVTKAKAAKAAFGLAPGLDPAIVTAANAAGLPFAPGVMTPSDISQAVRLGCRLMKFFPAVPAGGPKMLKSMNAPFRHLDLRFIPTGGVSEGSLADWLVLPEVAAIGGSWIASSKALREGDWTGIAERARAAVAHAGEIRP